MSAIDEDEDEDEDTDEDEEQEEDDESGEGLLSILAKSHLDDMIMPHLRKQMDPQSFKIFSETAYWCTKEDRADRPYIDQVVKRLEKALEHQSKHENPVNLTSPNHFESKEIDIEFPKKLQRIQVSKKNIRRASAICSKPEQSRSIKGEALDKLI
ncbi:hypothetical protein Tco_0450117 [Tanacetum coccineum]